MDHGKDQNIPSDREAIGTIASTDEPFEIQCYVTREDWIAANVQAMERRQEWVAYFREVKRKRVTEFGIGTAGVLFLVGLLWHFQYQPKAHQVAVFAIAGAAASILAGFIAATVSKKKEQRSSVRAVSAMDFSHYSGPTRAVCSKEHAFFERDEAMYQMPWRHVRCAITGEYLTFETLGSLFFVFPIRAFGSAEAQNRCFELATRWISEAQIPERDRVRLWLQGRSTPCPKCRYQLANLEGDRCPECGHVLTVDELNSRAAMRAM